MNPIFGISTVENLGNRDLITSNTTYGNEIVRV